MYARTHICICILTYVCISVCLYVCILECIHVRIEISSFLTKTYKWKQKTDRNTDRTERGGIEKMRKCRKLKPLQRGRPDTPPLHHSSETRPQFRLKLFLYWHLSLGLHAEGLAAPPLLLLLLQFRFLLFFLLLQLLSFLLLPLYFDPLLSFTPSPFSYSSFLLFIKFLLILFFLFILPFSYFSPFPLLLVLFLLLSFFLFQLPSLVPPETMLYRSML